MIDLALHKRLPAVLVAFVLVLLSFILGTGFFYYHSRRARMQADMKNELISVAYLKAGQAWTWLEERKADASILQANSAVAREVRGYLAGAGAGETLRRWIDVFCRHRGYDNATLIDTKGAVRLTYGTGAGGISPRDAAILSEALTERHYVFSDVQHDEDAEKALIALAVPLIDWDRQEGSLVGAFLFRIDPNHSLFPSIKSWPRASSTAEILILRLEGEEVVYLSGLRHRKEQDVASSVPASRTGSITGMAAQGMRGVVEGLDYRDVRVIAAIGAIPHSDWIIAAKIDQDELFAQFHRQLWIAIGLVLLMTATVASILGFWMRHKSAEWYRKRFEDEVKHRALVRHFESLVKHANDIIFLSDDSGKVVEFNDQAVRTYGYTPEELRSMHITAFHPPEDQQELGRLLEKIDAQEGMIFQADHVRKDGTRFPVEISARFFNVDGLRYLQSAVRDIKERKEAEQALRKSEMKYRSIVEQAKEGVYQSDGRQFLTVNGAFAQMLGYESPDELIRTITDSSRQLFSREEDYRRWETMLHDCGSVVNFETEFCRKDGSRIWVSQSSQEIRDEQGAILYYQGICEDITLRKGMEQERQESINILHKALGATVQAIVSMIETRDPYTAGHQRRVANLARAIGKEMGLASDQVNGLRMAAMIHDIGKVSVPVEILSKPTTLTKTEFELIKRHAHSGYEILKDIEFPWPIAEIVLSHHERMNGSGYPNRIEGQSILMEAKILAVADVVEAITTHRPYRPGQGLSTALDEIVRCTGELYDPLVVEACLALFRERQYQLL